MTSSPNSGKGGNDDANRLTAEQRELLEEIASWDEERFPLAKHARRILERTEEEESK